MFELIGFLFATGFLFAFASCIAAIAVGLVWLILRRDQARRRPFFWAAALIPILSAANIWICIAVLPYEEPFGDISQPLPNSYRLEALGKMPDFASITKAEIPSSGDGLSEYIGKVAVYGPLVVGQYSHPFGSFDARPNEPFFIFDTRDGHHIDLPSKDELQRTLGHAVTFEEVKFFRSEEPAYRRQMQVNHAIMFGPPILAFGLLIGSALLRRWKISRAEAKPYT